jgi:iron complex outermembrane recepter protein
VPGAAERRVLADLDGRLATGAAILTGTARLSLQRANAMSGLAFGAAPRRRDSVFAGDSTGGQDVAQYTVGGSIAIMPTMHWTHTLITGADGFRLEGLSAVNAAAPLQYTAAATLTGAEVAADRLSLRMRSVGRYDIAPATLLTLTLAAEQALTHELTSTGVSAGARPGAGGGVAAPGGAPLLRVALVPQGTLTQGTLWYNSGGVSAQGQLAWRDRWYGSLGVRAERISGATPNAQESLLPMVGVAHVRDIGAAVLKLRGAYGKGIRPARTPVSASAWLGRSALSTLSTLDPESQSGVEFGADLLVGVHTTVHVTRFDQRAAGLVQPVAALSLSPGNGGRLQRTVTYTLQNVGAITNRGWEVEARSRWHFLTLSGTLSRVDSRVDQVARGYRGELRPGDRMLDVPATTMSLSALWTTRAWTLTSTATRAADWIGYDRAALGEALGGAEAPRDLAGAGMRRYWITNDGLTRWRSAVSYRLRRDLSLMLVGDNLLNVQRGAPDNATVIMGRTVTIGVRTQF